MCALMSGPLSCDSPEARKPVWGSRYPWTNTSFFRLLSKQNDIKTINKKD